MKKILLFCVPMVFFISTGSCNDRFDGDEILNTDMVKIDSVKIALDTMDVFTTQTIKTYSTYTANCEGFYGYDYLHTKPLEREVTSYKFKTTADCGEMVARASQINFRPQETGTYRFKFFTGKDAYGENTYLEKLITVN